jgi:hypothetical protein
LSSDNKLLVKKINPKLKEQPMKLTPEQIEEWAVKYETTGKLPNTKIPCSTGCGVETTMFGDNLHKRVVKFGGIRNLLSTFVCRQQRQVEKMQALVAKINAAKAE